MPIQLSQAYETKADGHRWLTPAEERKYSKAFQRHANDKIKKTLNWNGLPICLEWLPGETRKYKDGYEKFMNNAYGYIANTVDDDGEETDVYLGPNPDSTIVFVIDKLFNDSGDYDEHKCMIGFDSDEEAKEAYLKHMRPSEYGGMKSYELPEFKEQFLRPVKAMKTAGAFNSWDYMLEQPRSDFQPDSKYSEGDVVKFDNYERGSFEGQLEGKIVDKEYVDGHFNYHIQVENSQTEDYDAHTEKYWVGEDDIRQFIRRGSKMAIKIADPVIIEADKRYTGIVKMIDDSGYIKVAVAGLGTSYFSHETLKPVKMKFATETLELEFLNQQLEMLKEDLKGAEDRERESLEQRIDELEREVRKVNTKMATSDPHFFDSVDDIRRRASDDNEIEKGTDETKRSPASKEVEDKAEKQLDENRHKGFPGEGKDQDKYELTAGLDAIAEELTMGQSPAPGIATKENAFDKQIGEGKASSTVAQKRVADLHQDIMNYLEENFTPGDSSESDMRQAVMEMFNQTAEMADSLVEDFKNEFTIEAGGPGSGRHKEGDTVIYNGKEYTVSGDSADVGRGMLELTDSNGNIISDVPTSKVQKHAKVTVQDGWGPNGDVTRTIKFEEINGDEAKALMDLLHHRPEDEVEEDIFVDDSMDKDDSIEKEEMQSPADQTDQTKSDKSGNQGSQENAPFEAPGMPGQYANKKIADYHCPHCGNTITDEQADSAENDVCPNCGEEIERRFGSKKLADGMEVQYQDKQQQTQAPKVDHAIQEGPGTPTNLNDMQQAMNQANTMKSNGLSAVQTMTELMNLGLPENDARTLVNQIYANTPAAMMNSKASIDELYSSYK